MVDEVTQMGFAAAWRLRFKSRAPSSRPAYQDNPDGA